MTKGGPGSPVPPPAPVQPVQPVDFAEHAGASRKRPEVVPSWAKGTRTQVVEWSPENAPVARPRQEAGRPERGERGERAERGERIEKPERAERHERPEPARAAERHERPEPARTADKPERVERVAADKVVEAREEDLAVTDDGEDAGGAELAAGMILMSEAELAERDADVAEAALGPFRESIARFDRIVSELEQRLREDVVDLSARIASALAQRELKLDRTLILDIARRALRLLGPLERVIVKCAESDAELLREHMPTLARAEAGRPVEVIVRPSDDIQPGGLLLTFDGGVVDAREERRLQRIVDAVKAAIQELENQFEPGDDGSGGGSRNGGNGNGGNAGSGDGGAP